MADKKNDKEKAMSKAALLQALAEKTGLTKKQVGEVVEHLDAIVKEQLGKKGPGKFVLPGVLQLRIIRKKATKEKVVENPFKKGEMMTVKAKPARNVVKARILKAFQDSVN
jgi:nucleoid DNA-binding protein